MRGDALQLRLFETSWRVIYGAVFVSESYKFRMMPRTIVQKILRVMHNAGHTLHPGEPLTASAHAIACYKLISFCRIPARRKSLHEPLDKRDNIFAKSEEEPADTRLDVGKLPG